jgi:protocatechuate 3,4-dioxygenase beta subunit
MLLKSTTILRGFATVILSCYLPCATYAQSVCGGRVVAPTDTTRPGANELISIIESKPRKSIFGVVNDVNGQPLKDVLVEVFALPPKGTDKDQKKRIIACVTDEKGRFCFRSIGGGRYEVFYSLDGGWKHTSLSIVVAPNNRKSVIHEIEVWLEVGT